MATVPVTRTAVAGEVTLASHFNTNIRDPLNFLLAPPIFRGRQTVLQAIANNTSVPLTIDVEDVDSAGGHSTVSNTSRYTAVYPGWYGHAGAVCWESNATGVRIIDWAKNGTGINGSRATVTPVTGVITSQLARTDKTFLNVGDYLELLPFQNSGGSRNTAVTGVEQSSFSLIFDSN